MKVFLPIILLLGIAVTANAKRLHPERYYQDKWCAEQGGQTEVVLEDKTRVDCLTDEYAVEVDFGSKWAEAIGQSLYYAKTTNRKPGILLILEKEKDQRYLQRIEGLAADYNIDIWTIRPDGFSARPIEKE